MTTIEEAGFSVADHTAATRVVRKPRMLAFLGPATLVAVGYMDPGNWATDLEGGARFGYRLLWILVACNWIALLLQTLATRLGVVTGLDLAEACREAYAPKARAALWLLAESGIIACDLAEVIGSAIALNLLFSIPVLVGAIITVADVFAVLLLQRHGMRTIEAIVLVLIATIAACFATEMFLIRPPVGDVLSGLRPSLTLDSLYVAIGIVGATVMPHNLYLHSSTVKAQTADEPAPPRRRALRLHFLDTAFALHVALLVNGAILVLSAAVFGVRGIAVTDLRDAHHLLSPLLGSQVAAILFAVALLCAGQSSTIAGTLAGQIVMDGFLRMRVSLVTRRLVTRGLALVPAVGVLAIYGEQGTLPLLMASQVVLSLQLPFAVVPLIRLTSSARWMGAFASARWLKWAAIASAVLVIALNVVLVAQGALSAAAASQALGLLLGGGLLAWLAFLAWISWVRLAPRAARPSDGDDATDIRPRPASAAARR